MNKNTLIVVTISIFLSGCTQLITAPISIAGTLVSTTIDVGSSVVRAAIPDDDKDE